MLILAAIILIVGSSTALLVALLASHREELRHDRLRTVRPIKNDLSNDTSDMRKI